MLSNETTARGLIPLLGACRQPRARSKAAAQGTGLQLPAARGPRGFAFAREPTPRLGGAAWSAFIFSRQPLGQSGLRKEAAPRLSRRP